MDGRWFNNLATLYRRVVNEEQVNEEQVNEDHLNLVPLPANDTISLDTFVELTVLEFGVSIQQQIVAGSFDNNKKLIKGSFGLLLLMLVSYAFVARAEGWRKTTLTVAVYLFSILALAGPQYAFLSS